MKGHSKYQVRDAAIMLYSLTLSVSKVYRNKLGKTIKIIDNNRNTTTIQMGPKSHSHTDIGITNHRSLGKLIILPISPRDRTLQRHWSTPGYSSAEYITTP